MTAVLSATPSHAGQSLAARVRAAGPMPVAEAIALGRALAASLSATHRRGVIHRGISPDAVTLLPDGNVRLSEYVLARPGGHSTAPAGLAGPVPPEVGSGQPWDARADIYSLGLTLFYALTGGTPASAGGDGPPLPAADGYRPGTVREGIPQWLDGVVGCATAALPGDRYSSAAGLLDALSTEGRGHAPTPVRPAAAARCLLCGQADQTGIGLCAECLEPGTGEPCALVFVHRTPGMGSPEAVEQRLRELPAGPLGDEAIRVAARGRRALARVPVRYAGLVIEHLSRRNIPAHVRGEWAALPRAFYGILAVMGVCGTAAGMVLSPVLLYATPLLVGLMWLEAQRQTRSPVL